MVKNFSVDWLAQSYHDSKQDPEALEDSPAAPKRHVLCSVQPRPPTSYDKVYLQPKPKCLRTEQKTPVDMLKEKESVLFNPSPRNCSSPSSSENSGYSSGYESEAASSECPSVEDSNDADKDLGTQRRVRTKFTPEQIDKLEKIFNKHKYLDAGERVKTALKLSLSETQVRTWFQNRRMKLKREVQEMRGDYLVPAMTPVLFPGVSPVQHPCYSGQRAALPPLMMSPLAFQQTPMPHQHMIPSQTFQQASSHHHQLMIPQHSHPMLSTQQLYY
ncbi:homeobox protein vent1-like [Astyanax mexicanus]|uniref:Homeobox protein vent1-like n=1 Tax=Astyanax mexicanus TaxID=7994 RepID=A0A8B9H0X1_ASTMX|nr:homeobox protein vent1-like [Astyanax mexicanus]